MPATSPDSRINPDLLKTYRSKDYRKKVKRIIENVVNLRGGKITKRPPQLKRNPTETERAAFELAGRYRCDLDTVRYFASNERGQYERTTRKTGE